MTPAALLRHAIEALRQSDITYLITGSIAAAYFGENRNTHDVDIIIWVDRDDPRLVTLCSHFTQPGYYVSLEAAMDASRRGGQFNVISEEAIFKIDFMVSAKDLFDRSRLARRRTVDLPGIDGASLASPEDVIIKKMTYYKEGGSEKHLRDITGILEISGLAIDRAYIAHWAAHFKVEDVWNAVLDRLRG